MKWFSLAFLLLAACDKQPARTALSVEAYVWQSPDRPQVRAAMAQAAQKVTRLHVRAAELKWQSDHFAIERPLTALPTPGCGLVMRIGASASRLEWTPAQLNAVAEVVRSLAALGPHEIQCDYDCPQKRLGRYRVLLDALQAAAGKVPVVPTTLPSWLDEPEFAKLIEHHPGYVLQVHSLQLPKDPDSPLVVFDPQSARAAANKAAKLKIPFRIAMATYGCEVRFGADGKVADVISEDVAELNPAAGKRVFALADPLESARLVREWTANPPQGLQGLVWYRLPVEGDRRNWPWATFERVIRGEDGNPKIDLVDSHGSPRDLFLSNAGNFPARLPKQVIVNNPVVAADGGGSYQLENQADGLHFLLREDVWPWLDPGKRIPIGWLRNREESAPIEWHLPP